MGYLGQDTGPVAAVLLRADAAAVGHVGKRVQRLLDQRVRALPLDVGDQSDAAGIVFECRVIQSRGMLSSLGALHKLIPPMPCR